MLPKVIIIVAAFFGGSGVMLGAFGAHALRGQVEARLLETFQTGVQYQLVHAVALMVLALLMEQWGRLLSLDIAAYALAVGVLLFSGSLYVLVLTEIRWVGPITPLGGLCFIVGWVALLIAGVARLG